MIIAQVGIAGSAVIGDRVTLAGQVGVVGHIKIGDDAIIAAKSGISKNIPAGQAMWSGIPAISHAKDLRIQATTRKLPEILDIIREMQERIEFLERELEEHKSSIPAEN